MTEVRVDRRGIAMMGCLACLAGLDVLLDSMRKGNWGFGDTSLTLALLNLSVLSTLACIAYMFLFQSFYRCPTCRTRLRCKIRGKDRSPVYRCPRCRVEWDPGWEEE